MIKSNQKVEKILSVPAADVWSIVGAVSGVDKWLAPITSCRVEGNNRYCGTEDGEFKEDILNVDDEKMLFEYAIPKQHMMPVENIEGSMQVEKVDENSAKVTWKWNYDVLPENEAAAKEGLAQVGSMGLDGIQNLILSQSAV